jgi:UPF0755 protein
MLKRLMFVVGALAVLAGGLAGWEWWRLERPYRGFTEADVFVDLPTGDSVAAMATKLADAGVVPDAFTFRLAARLSHTDRRLNAGEYRFTAAATPYDVAARLARGDVYRIGVVFPEGLTIAEMASIFAASGLGTAEEFTRAAADTLPIASYDPAATDLEGYLFPDSYAFSRHVGADAAVRAMVKAFEHAVGTADFRAAAVAQGMSLRDVVTLASMIEKETARPEERPLVSAVFHNRLKLRMPMQCDPTVIYALMRAGRWNGNVTHADLQINSPYNTYRYGGLPPGPIAAPGLASLTAAVHPADVPFLYFVSRNDGTHVFAATLAEHNRNVQRFQIKRGPR